MDHISFIWSFSFFQVRHCLNFHGTLFEVSRSSASHRLSSFSLVKLAFVSLVHTPAEPKKPVLLVVPITMTIFLIQSKYLTRCSMDVLNLRLADSQISRQKVSYSRLVV